jgi:hypothetical protein
MKRSHEARRRSWRCALAVACWLGCGHDGPTAHQDQAEYVTDAAAFTNNTEDDVRALVHRGGAPLSEEWALWEQRRGPMTPARIEEFYKHTSNPIFELGDWHLWNAAQRTADLAFVDELRKSRPNNILVFGDGCGLTAVRLARAGFDVTLGDLDTNLLRFGLFRAERHAIPIKAWRADFDAAAPQPKYDLIVVRDLLAQFPRDQLDAVVDKLIQLKRAGTQVIITPPGGPSTLHLLHPDADDHVKQLFHRLQTEQPKA